MPEMKLDTPEKTDERRQHSVLGVPVAASADEIRAAYRRRALETHPDKGGNAELFREVKAAYEVAMAEFEGKSVCKRPRSADGAKGSKRKRSDNQTKTVVTPCPKPQQVSHRSDKRSQSPQVKHVKTIFASLEAEVLAELRTLPAVNTPRSKKLGDGASTAAVASQGKPVSLPIAQVWNCLTKLTPGQRMCSLQSMDVSCRQRLTIFLFDAYRRGSVTPNQGKQ